MEQKTHVVSNDKILESLKAQSKEIHQEILENNRRIKKFKKSTIAEQRYKYELLDILYQRRKWLSDSRYQVDRAISELEGRAEEKHIPYAEIQKGLEPMPVSNMIYTNDRCQFLGTLLCNLRDILRREFPKLKDCEIYACYLSNGKKTKEHPALAKQYCTYKQIFEIPEFEGNSFQVTRELENKINDIGYSFYYQCPDGKIIMGVNDGTYKAMQEVYERDDKMLYTYTNYGSYGRDKLKLKTQIKDPDNVNIITLTNEFLTNLKRHGFKLKLRKTENIRKEEINNA